MMLYSEKLKLFAAAHSCKVMTVDGAQYRYVLAGKDNGKTLVFLNGGMNTLEMWMDYVDLLAEDCRVLTRMGGHRLAAKPTQPSLRAVGVPSRSCATHRSSAVAGAAFRDRKNYHGL